MIVDDEPEIRQGLRLKVDWDQFRLQITAEASNGQEALDRLQKEDFDIVITDMKMPLMNGVTLLESCCQRFPRIQLIVITGYDDFQYAKAAVKNNVSDYILKPVARKELSLALTKIVDVLDKERSLKNQQMITDWKLSQYFKEMREHFIVSIVKDIDDYSESMVDRARMFHLDSLILCSVRIVTVGIKRKTNEFTDAMERYGLPFRLLCREFVENFGTQIHVFLDANHPLIMNFIVRDQNERIENFIKTLTDCIAQYLNIELVVGVGEAVQGLNKWKEGYISSLLAWNFNHSGIEDAARELTTLQDRPSSNVTKFMHWHLVNGELEAFEQLVQKELEYTYTLSFVLFVKMIFHTIIIIQSVAESLGITLQDLNQVWVNPEKVWTLSTVEKACAYLFDLSEKMNDHSQSKSEEGDQSVVESMKEMIERNYMVDLNLSLIADRYHYNASYLSDLFKNKVGQSFIQYVTEVRMLKARQLLKETALSLADIAELIGLSSASYFSTKFKKIYGISPTDYRQKNT